MNHEVREINRGLEERLGGHQEENSNIPEVTDTIQEIAESDKSPSTPSLNERFQRYQLRTTGGKPGEATNEDKSNERKQQTTFEWLNFEKASHERTIVFDQYDKTERTLNSSTKRNHDSEKRSAPECFECRGKGHVIRDCSKCPNFKITLPVDKKEINKPKIRSNF